MCPLGLTLAITLTLSFQGQDPWPHMTLIMDFQGPIWNNYISGMVGPIDIEQKERESVIHDHYHDLLVTKVRCKDQADSNRGDFRYHHTIDWSSSIWIKCWFTKLAGLLKHHTAYDLLSFIFMQGSHAFWKTQGNGLSMENQGTLRKFAKLLREF